MEKLTKEKAIEISNKTHTITDKWGRYKRKHQYVFIKANIQTDGIMIMFGGQKRIEGKFRIYADDDEIYIMKPRATTRGILLQELENPTYKLIK